MKLQVAKGQVTPSVASQPSLKKVPSLDKEHSTPTSSQKTPTLTKAFERSETDVAEDIPTADDEGNYVYLLRLIHSIFIFIFF